MQNHIAAITLIGMLISAGNVAAQAYPIKPIRMIIPTAPGGPSDLNGRGIAQALSEAYGQPVVVENRPGADSIIGNEACARSTPDGYTLCTSDGGGYSLNPAIRLKMPYEPLRDLQPIILTGMLYSALIVHPSLPVSSVKELFELVKAKPGTISFATSGQASQPTIIVEYLRRVRGLDFLAVPYKVQTQGATAVMAGEAMVTTFTIGQSANFAKAGKVKVLAQNSDGRSRHMPDVPSYKEAGFDVYIRNWLGFFGPAGLPREMVQRLNADVNRNLLQNPALRDKFLTANGLEIEGAVGGSSDSFLAFLKADREYYANIVKAAGIKPVE
jgi:tripartite-type tricarboxylate transporter receptor subunit TctC